MGRMGIVVGSVGIETNNEVEHNDVYHDYSVFSEENEKRTNNENIEDVVNYYYEIKALLLRKYLNEPPQSPEKNTANKTKPIPIPINSNMFLSHFSVRSV